MGIISRLPNWAQALFVAVSLLIMLEIDWGGCERIAP